MIVEKHERRMTAWLGDRNSLLTQGGCLLILASAVGCGGGDLAQVGGRVVTHDGQPLVGARVIARSSTDGATVTSGTDQEGRFQLKMPESGPGVPPGSYDVMVVEDRGPIDGQRPPKISAKYQRVSSSGIAFEVAAGERKDVDWTLEAPASPRR